MQTDLRVLLLIEILALNLSLQPQNLVQDEEKGALEQIEPLHPTP